MTKQLKYTVLKIFKFLIIIIMVDFSLGFLANQLFFSQETGKFARSTYVITKADENIIVFGSSHALRHFVPEVIEQKTKKTCYNAGADGQQLVYHSALQKMMLKRIQPQLIILNIDENFLYKAKKAYDRLNDLHPYYSHFRSELTPFLSLNLGYTDPKLLFKSYQNNSTLIQAIKYYLIPQKAFQGYRPLYEKMTPYKLANQKENPTEIVHIEEIDTTFVKVFKNFISEAKRNRVKLVFITSPNLIPKDVSDNISFSTIKAISKSEKIPFYDYINTPEFIGNLDFFYDPSHLNDDGAKYFTEKISEAIFPLLNSN